MKNMKTLIVEDEITSRLLLKALLSPWGECDEACEGREAVQMFGAAVNRGVPYDLVLMDIMMPELDGQHALRAMRRFEEQAGIFGDAQCRVLMVTALSDQNQVLEAFMRGGAIGYLVKPIEKARLYGELRKLGFLGHTKAMPG